MAFQQDAPYILSPLKSTELEIDATGQKKITVAIETKGMKSQLQGRIPITLILDHEDATFDNGEKEILWHSWVSSVNKSRNSKVNNDSLIYVNLDINEGLTDRKILLHLEKEVDISKLAALGAFFPQILPIVLMGEVTWGPAPTIFYDALMRWNFKLFGGDVIKLARELVTSSVFENHKTLLTQCTTEFSESFLLFNISNYGETGGNSRGKIETFRNHVMTAAIKRLLDCMSSTVSEALIAFQNQAPTEWLQLQSMNSKSIDGLSKIIIGYGFNVFAFEAGDILKSVKKTIKTFYSNGIFPQQYDEKLRADIDRSLVKAIQHTLQSGHEDFFSGQLKYYSLNESYSLPIATGTGFIEILWRIFNLQSLYTRETKHQFNSITKRTEAIAVSLLKYYPSSNLSDSEILFLGVLIPASLNVAIVATNFYYPDLFQFYNAAYEGFILGSLTYFIAPTLQRYGVWTLRSIQKPLLDYLNSAANSWSEYFLADEIRYRVHISIYNQ